MLDLRGVVAAVLLVSAAGCAPRTRAGQVTTVLGGVAMTVAGAATLDLVRRGDGTESGGATGEIACAVTCLPAALLAIAGVVLVGDGLVAASTYTEPEAPAESHEVAERRAQEQAHLRRTNTFARPLPERAADPGTIRLARQVRAAVLAGDCSAATVALGLLERQDTRYHADLVRSPVVDGCRVP